MRDSDVKRTIDNLMENLKSGGNQMAGDGGYQESTREKYDAFVKIRNQSLNMLETKKYDYPEDKWFDDRGHWIIRKVPNTKNEFYVAVGDPPPRILKIYEIKDFV